MKNSPTEPISTADSAADRRLQILMASAQLFAKHGFHATGMRQICQAVQLSPGALYRYFASKEAIIAGLIAWDRQRTTDWFNELPLEQGLMACLEKIKDLSGADFEDEGFFAMWSEITAEAARNPSVREHLAAHYAYVEKLLANLIRNAVTAGDIRPDVVPEQAAVNIMCGYEGLMVRRSVLENFDFEKASTQLLSFIADALGSRRPASERRVKK